MSQTLVTDLLEKAKSLIELGRKLIGCLEAFKDIIGMQKLRRKINREIKFLEKVITDNTLKWNHVNCSNLTHYEFLIDVLFQQKNVIRIDCGLSVQARPYKIKVDIVCENGDKWIKVSTRNSKCLSSENNRYGSRNIFKQVDDLIGAALENKYMFKTPTIVLYFRNKIEKILYRFLSSKGVILIEGEPLYTSDSFNISRNCVQKLNLDVSTLVAYISNISNAYTNYDYQISFLNKQSSEERETPLKPILDNFFNGKHLICCQTTFIRFKNIVLLLAGVKEKLRFENLINRIEVLPDVKIIPPEMIKLKLNGKINQKTLLTFAFGIFMKAITVTSNKAFVNSVKMQGIHIPVFIHQTRALTEVKENGTIEI